MCFIYYCLKNVPYRFYGMAILVQPRRGGLFIIHKSMTQVKPHRGVPLVRTAGYQARSQRCREMHAVLSDPFAGIPAPWLKAAFQESRYR